MEYIQVHGEEKYFTFAHSTPLQKLRPFALRELTSCLLQLPDGILALGGDLNIVANEDLDRARPKISLRNKNPLSTFLETMGLMDVWQLRIHPGDSSPYSNSHDYYSRIDYFLTQ